MATTVTSLAAAGTTSASPPPTITIAITSAAGTAFTRTFRTRGARFYRCNDSVYAVEVWLIVRIELRAAFDHCRRCALRHCGRRN